MAIKTLGILLITIFLSSCGASPEEIKARETFVIDSLNKVNTHEAFLRDSLLRIEQDSIATSIQRAEEMRIHLERIEVGKSMKEAEFKRSKKKLLKQIEDEKLKITKLNRASNKRTVAQTVKQLTESQKKIIKLERYAVIIEDEIAYCKLFENYDFQDTPEGTVQHLFDAAKNKDYSKLRHLIDPYGEWDDDVLQLVMVDGMPTETVNQYEKNFSKGRIMGDPVVTGDKAEVEIAFGSSSNRLEKIHLVNRMNKWYLLSF